MSVDHAGPVSLLRAWQKSLRCRSIGRILAGAAATFSLAQGTLLAQQFAPPAVPAPVPSSQVQNLQLETPAISGKVDAVHSPNVEQMLKPQYHLEIERRHSQLVITSKRVRRIAVTDSTVANYVQYSESEISIVGLELGKTDLTLWFEGEETPSIYEVSVVRDASLEEQRTIDFGKLERRLKVLYPNSTCALIPVGAQVLVRGTAYDAEEAQNILQVVRTEVFRSMGRFNDLDNGAGLNVFAASGNLAGGAGGGGGNNGANSGFRDILINELVVPGEYNITLRVVVAELNRSELRNAGIDWRVLFNDGRHAVGSNMGGTPSTLSGIFENGEIQIFVRWLQSNGSIKMLAEPRLTVLSGTGASILAGGEFAVPTIIGLGGGQATSFRGFGTSLVVTPTVIDRDMIRMQVVPEFSELNAANAVDGIPGTNVKRVQTTVELREGQTFAIGGLISRQTLAEVSRVPLLGDIPWVGPRVFQSKKASEVETELLVLVSPEIVRPMEPDEVPPVPGFNVTHPSDEQLWHRGQTEGPPDNNVYQIAPFGTGQMTGVPQGYNLYNPAVNSGGFVPPAGDMSATYSSGPVQPFGGSMTPQPDYSVPPMQYQPQMQPQMQMQMQPQIQYQGAPMGVQGQPMPAYPQGAPGMAPAPIPQPGSQLPPVPPAPNWPAQGQVSPQSQQKPSMLTRMGSAFRRDNTPNGTVKNTSWSRSGSKK